MTSQETCAQCGQPIEKAPQKHTSQREYRVGVWAAAVDLAVSFVAFLAAGTLSSRVLERVHQARLRDRLTDHAIARQLDLDIQDVYADRAPENSLDEFNRPSNDGGIR
jgi:hypothetical protein